MADQTTLQELKEFVEFTRMKRIDDNVSLQHLRQLIAVLPYARQILEREETDFVSPHITKLQESLDSLVMKSELLSEDQKESHLTIEARDSGYPTNKDWFYLMQNQATAEQEVKSLPGREELIDAARDAIFFGKYPEDQQRILMRIKFLEYLRDAKIFEKFTISPMQKGKSDQKQRHYTVNWHGFENGSSVPLFYHMKFTQDKSSSEIDEESAKQLMTFLYAGFELAQSPLTLAHAIEERIADIHPKFIRRVRLGPFYTKTTQNPEALQGFFEGVNAPYLLMLGIETAFSIDVRYQTPANFLKRMLGMKIEKQVFTGLENTIVVVPFALQQEFLDPTNPKNIFNSGKIYGITDKGDICEQYTR